MIDTEPVLDDSSTGDLAPDTTIPLRRWVMAGMMLFLNLLDVIVTKAILSHGGSEANPVMAPIIDHPAYPLILKAIVSVGVGALLLASPRSSKLADRSVMAVILLYVIVMGWNFGVLLQAVGVYGPV